MGWEDEHGHPSDATGKRLRPLFTLHVATIRGGAFEPALPAAAAVELVHNFSLVHDEIQDQDEERHGRPTLWKLLGTAQAINAGDYLFSRAYAALAGLTCEPDAARSALTILTSATERMIDGQWADLSFEARARIEPAEYLEMVAGKTGALIGAAAALGALCGGAPAEEVSAFRRWGVALGLAFQARDDYLGIWGNVSVTGKSNTNDLTRRKKTLPVLLGLGRPESAEALERFYDGPDSDVDAVVAALEASGIKHESDAIASRYLADADALLAGMNLPADQEAECRAIGRLLVERDR